MNINKMSISFLNGDDNSIPINSLVDETEVENQIPEDNQQRVSNSRFSNQQHGRILGGFDLEQHTSFAFNFHLENSQRTNENLRNRQVTTSSREQENGKATEAARSILLLTAADSQQLIPYQMGCGNPIARINSEQPYCYSFLIHHPTTTTTSSNLHQEVTVSQRQQQDIQKKIDAARKSLLNPNASSQEHKLQLCPCCVKHVVESDQLIKDQRIIDAWRVNPTDERAIRDCLYFLFQKERWSSALFLIRQALMIYPQSEEFLSVYDLLLVITQRINQQYYQQIIGHLQFA